MTRHVLIVGALWIVFSVIGEVLVLSFTPFPIAAAEQAHIVDDAFTLLTILAVPIFAFVSAVLLYSMFSFRTRGEPTEEGPPYRSHTPFIGAWFVITVGLTIAVIIHPGITGINELREGEDEDVDLVVQVEGRRFVWIAKYPEQNVQSFRELVLPKDAHVQFRVTSFDVIHSLWIPAFRVKIDAVPGIFTSVKATPTELGTFEKDVNFRLQCAELCGVGHAVMRMPVRVVEQAEFDHWAAEQSPLRAQLLDSGR